MVPSKVFFEKRRLRLLPVCLVCLAAAGVTTGCVDTGCDAMQRYYPIFVEVRDPQGEPGASGARVIVTSGGEVDTLWAGLLPPRTSIGIMDVYSLWAKVRVEKPWYEPVERLVGINRDVCGYSSSASVRVNLTLLPNAPPVRSVFVGRESLLFIGTDTLQLYATVDVAEGVSDSVVWWSGDTTVAVVDGTGLVRSKCRDVYGQAYVGATSVADSTVSDSILVPVLAATEGCN